jgi:hypothetical protein
MGVGGGQLEEERSCGATEDVSPPSVRIADLPDEKVAPSVLIGIGNAGDGPSEADLPVRGVEFEE